MANLKSFIQLKILDRPTPSQSVDGERKRKCAVLEGVCLATVILVIIGLCSLPVVFFYLPPSNTLEMNHTEIAILAQIPSVCRSNLSDENMNGSYPRSCSEDFFCDETTQGCVPKCPEWTLFAKEASLALDYAYLIATPLGVLAGIGVLVVSCIRWRKVYVFPPVLVIYQTISFLIFITLPIISFIGRGQLHCTSPNLLESIDNATNYCIAAGVIFHYVSLQINIWWVLHMILLFWKIYFPIHARRIQSSKHLRVIHALCVLVALLVPLIPAFAPFISNAVIEARTEGPVTGTHGFGPATFPPSFCMGINKNVTFYSLILPNVFLLIVGATTLILAVWKIHKVQGVFHSNSKGSFHVSTAEKKLLLVFFYNIFLQTLLFIQFSLAERVPLDAELSSYFICERSGPAQPCDRSGFEALVHPEIAIVTALFGTMTPTIYFVFVIDCKELKQKIKAGMTSTNTA